MAEVYEREVRDLPWSEYRTTVVIELYRVRCPDCGIKAEKVPLLPSKAPFSQRFEEAVGQACESASVRRVARQFGLAASTVRAIDLRYLRRWAEGRRRPALRQMGVDEIYLGKKQKFLTVVTNLETGEPLWFGRERKKQTLDEFFEKHLSAFQRSAIRAACVDMWEPFRQSLEQWVPECRIDSALLRPHDRSTRQAAAGRMEPLSRDRNCPATVLNIAAVSSSWVDACRNCTGKRSP
jgi:transposase